MSYISNQIFTTQLLKTAEVKVDLKTQLQAANKQDAPALPQGKSEPAEAGKLYKNLDAQAFLNLQNLHVRQNLSKGANQKEPSTVIKSFVMAPLLKNSKDSKDFKEPSSDFKNSKNEAKGLFGGLTFNTPITSNDQDDATVDPDAK